MKHEKYTVTGMTCSSCSSRVEKTVSQLPGVITVSVNLLTNSMQVDYDEARLSDTEIIAAVTHAGYGASLAGAPDRTAEKSTLSSAAVNAMTEMKFRLISSLIFLIPTMYIASHRIFNMLFGLPVPSIITAVFDGPQNAIAYAFSQFLLILPIMYFNRHYYINGFRNLFRGAPNMDSLVGLGSAAAAAFGIFALFRIGWGLGYGDMELVRSYSSNLYFESAGMIVTLITVGKYLEARAKSKTSEALEKLMDLAPKEATVIRNGAASVIPVSDLVVGDEIFVRPGESIPSDGVIIEGTTSIDESALTGESIPVDKEPGDTVTAATLNKSGAIRMTAQRIGEDTTISQIIRLVDEASSSKAPIAKIADKISGIFVPAVIAIALITIGVWYLLLGATLEFSFSAGISVLVISCPCALGLATPVAIMVGTGKGAENGILIKSGEALERAHSIDTVVMDKTGTITEGKPVVTDIIPIGTTKKDLLPLAVGLEGKSEHPLAQAIVTYGEARDVSPAKVDDFSALFGRGVRGTIDGTLYYAGNLRLMKENGIPTDDVNERLNNLADEGKTPILFATNTGIQGIIAVADMEKQTSAAAIDCFRRMGIDVVMLTGDNKRTARAVQKRLRIPKVIAEVLPQDKEKHIAELQDQNHQVAMIGDGINDAPALMKADLGIAIGAGTDVAIESADAVLMKNDLLDAVTVVRLSKAVIKNVKENLFWAFIYNVIGIPLAAGLFYPAFGLKLNPMIGAAAMSLSSFCVVMNALRLRFFKVTYPNVSRETILNTTHTFTTSKEVPAMKTTLHIDGMMCDHCKKHVTEALSAMDGITDVIVNLENKSADVTVNREISTDEFDKVIADAGYTLVK